MFPALPVFLKIYYRGIYLLKFYIGFTCNIIVTTTISTSKTTTTLNYIQIQTLNLQKGFTLKKFHLNLNNLYLWYFVALEAGKIDDAKNAIKRGAVINNAGKLIFS